MYLVVLASNDKMRIRKAYRNILEMLGGNRVSENW